MPVCVFVSSACLHHCGHRQAQCLTTFGFAVWLAALLPCLSWSLSFGSPSRPSMVTRSSMCTSTRASEHPPAPKGSAAGPGEGQDGPTPTEGLWDCEKAVELWAASHFLHQSFMAGGKVDGCWKCTHTHTHAHTYKKPFYDHSFEGRGCNTVPCPYLCICMFVLQFCLSCFVCVAVLRCKEDCGEV